MGDAMQDDNGGPTGLPADPPSTDLLKFRNRVPGPFDTLQRQHNYAEMATKWQLEQEELHVDQGIGDDQLKLLAENAGINDIEKMTLLQALRAYEIRKGLRVDVVGQCFVPVTDVAAPPTTSTAQGPGGAQNQNSSFTPEKISELVQLLAAIRSSAGAGVIYPPFLGSFA